jgi:hypothetical protein
MIFEYELPARKFFRPMVEAYARNAIESDEVDLGTIDLIEIRLAELKRQDEQIAKEAASIASKSPDRVVIRILDHAAHLSRETTSIPPAILPEIPAFRRAG